jgi:GMP synthase (glutamine-hydrolysing)
MQLMAHMLGGKVEPSDLKEYGRREYTIEEKSPLVEGIMLEDTCWMSHTDQLTDLPDGFINLGSTETTPHAIMANEDKLFYGIQFHPEVKHTPEGQKFLENFLYNICGCTKNWTMDSYIEEEVAEIRALVGDKQVLCGLSGGVDSAVASMLVHKAIGDQLTCMFIDHGMLRKMKEKV